MTYNGTIMMISEVGSGKAATGTEVSNSRGVHMPLPPPPRGVMRQTEGESLGDSSIKGIQPDLLAAPPSSVSGLQIQYMTVIHAELEKAKTVGLVPLTQSDRLKGIYGLCFNEKVGWMRFMNEEGFVNIGHSLTDNQYPLHVTRFCALIGGILRDNGALLKMCSSKYDTVKAEITGEFPNDMAEKILITVMKKHATTTFAKYADVITKLDRVSAIPKFTVPVKALITDWFERLREMTIEIKHFYRIILRAKEELILKELEQKRAKVNMDHLDVEDQANTAEADFD